MAVGPDGSNRCIPVLTVAHWFQSKGTTIHRDLVIPYLQPVTSECCNQGARSRDGYLLVTGKLGIPIIINHHLSLSTFLVAPGCKPSLGVVDNHQASMNQSLLTASPTTINHHKQPSAIFIIHHYWLCPYDLLVNHCSSTIFNHH